MRLMLLFACVVAVWAQPAASLRGTVTDPSGATVPGAAVQLGSRRTRTNATGQYEFGPLAPGRYAMRIQAKGFTRIERKNVRIAGETVLDIRLAIEPGAQSINVDDQLRGVSTDPASNRSAVLMRRSQIGTLSDDPDELV